jgi:hypothetical protein
MSSNPLYEYEKEHLETYTRMNTTHEHRIYLVLNAVCTEYYWIVARQR